MGVKVKNPDLIPTRRTLLGRLADLNDHDGWQEFFDTYWRLIYEVALRAGLTESEAEEVVQETLISVARQMPEFRYDPHRGRFKGWLLQITHRRIADQIRKQKQANGATGAAPVERVGPDRLETLADSEDQMQRIWDQEWERHLLNTALANVRKRVRPEQYQLFDLYVLQQWPLRKITATLGVSAGRVYLVKHRIGTLLRKEIRSLENGEAAVQ